jgi:hypothetical protein
MMQSVDRRGFLKAGTGAALASILPSAALADHPEPVPDAVLDSMRRVAMAATARLVIKGEGNVPSYSSGALIVPPDSIKVLIPSDALLMVTAGHNTHDWGPTMQIRAEFFTVSSGGKVSKGENVSARVFSYCSANQGPLAPDVGLLLVQVPADSLDAKAFSKRALVLGSPNNSDLKWGEMLVTVGCPGGSDAVAIQGRCTTITRSTAQNRGQLDIAAAIEPGHSGGAIVNAHSELVGVASGTTRVAIGTVDYLLPGAEKLIYEGPPLGAEAWFAAKTRALVPEDMWNATGRSNFTPVSDIHDFIRVTAEKCVEADRTLAGILDRRRAILTRAEQSGMFSEDDVAELRNGFAKSLAHRAEECFRGLGGVPDRWRQRIRAIVQPGPE